MSMRPQIPVRSSESEQALQFIRQMGIENVSLMLGPDELTAEAIRAQKNKLAAFGLRISDAACMELQKNKSIHLGLPDRDHEIDRFNQMLRVFGEEEIPLYLHRVAAQRHPAHGLESRRVHPGRRCHVLRPERDPCPPQRRRPRLHRG